MTTRYFDWRDLLRLYTIRGNMVFLYNELALTSGGLRLLEAIFSNVMPSGRAQTLVCTNSGSPWFGQVVHQPGDEYAFLSFLAPANRLEETLAKGDGILELLDELVSLAGCRGALRLLADVEEHSPAALLLHQVGFSVYTRQRVWRMAGSRAEGGPPLSAHAWRPVTWSDSLPIMALVNNLVPGLVQKIEPPYGEKPCGLVCYQAGELAAYVEIHQGLKGIYAWPFIHPDAEGLSQELGGIIYTHTGATAHRPLFICISHYQSWLENALEAHDAQPGPQQVLMAKYLAARQVPAPAFAIHSLERGQAKTIAFSTRGEQFYETPSHH